MPYYNKILLIGHVGRDPEPNITRQGNYMWRFSLAVSRGKDKEPDWFNVTVFDNNSKLSEFLQKIKKGDLIFVEGELHITKGDKRTFVDVLASRLKLLSSKKVEETSEFYEEELDLESEPF